MQHFFVGIDGGGTKSLVRIENEQGECLGQTIGGPANIRLSVELAWQSINEALAIMLTPLGLSLGSPNQQWHAGMGLAGCEVKEAYDAFLARENLFTTLVVSSDAHVACLGAHGGKDGAIIIIGTGVVGLQIEDKQIVKVGGWGFPYDDQGSGAWIGLQALQHTLSWYDGREKASELTSVIFQHFQENLAKMLEWASNANSTAYATLAPLVVDTAAKGDIVAQNILHEAANAISLVHQTLLQKQHHQQYKLPCALIGGLARFIEPYLPQSMRQCVRPPLATPDCGAVQLVKQYLINHSAI
jgi:glucosamine kinase